MLTTDGEYFTYLKNCPMVKTDLFKQVAATTIINYE